MSCSFRNSHRNTGRRACRCSRPPDTSLRQAEDQEAAAGQPAIQTHLVQCDRSGCTGQPLCWRRLTVFRGAALSITPAACMPRQRCTVHLAECAIRVGMGDACTQVARCITSSLPGGQHTLLSSPGTYLQEPGSASWEQHKLPSLVSHSPAVGGPGAVRVGQLVGAVG